MMDGPAPTITRTGGGGISRLIGGLMIGEALTFAAASALHFDITLPLGFTTIRGESFPGAAIPEAIIAGVLLGGAIGVFASPRGSWGLALTTTLFALAGVIIGLSVILSGRVSRPGDVTYHTIILFALIGTIALQLTPMGRRAMRRGP
jgi:hypothetical protein